MNEEAEALTQRRTPYSLACEILELRRKRDARDDKILTQRMELARLEQMREELVAERDALAAHMERCYRSGYQDGYCDKEVGGDYNPDSGWEEFDEKDPHG